MAYNASIQANWDWENALSLAEGYGNFADFSQVIAELFLEYGDST